MYIGLDKEERVEVEAKKVVPLESQSSVASQATELRRELDTMMDTEENLNGKVYIIISKDNNVKSIVT